MWPEHTRVNWNTYRAATADECKAEMRAAYASCRDSLETAKQRHARELARIRQHRDDMLTIWQKRLSEATV